MISCKFRKYLITIGRNRVFMRDDKFLEGRLKIILDRHFADVAQPKEIIIKYGRRAKKRLGSIGLKQCADGSCQSQILINGHFRHPSVPHFVIDATIAHELCHYTHGFSSPLPQLFEFPHQGDVVDRELECRGLGHLVQAELAWLRRHWRSFLKHYQTDPNLRMTSE